MRQKHIGFLGLAAWLCMVPSAVANEGSVEDALLDKFEKASKKVARGMEKLGESHTGHLEKRASTTIDVQLDLARCYTFMAVGGKGVIDLSLTISAHGKEIAADRISGEKPAAKWCSPGRVKTEVKVTMYNGSGPFVLGVFAEKVDATANAEKVGGKENDFIANRVRQLHGQFGKGRAAISPLFRGNLSTGSEKIFKVRLTGGHCYTVISAGSPSVRNLDIVLFDPSDRELDNDDSKNSFPSLETDPCPRSGGQYRIKIRMFSGFGQFGFQVFSD
ncbi:MAG: hypothetical protein GY847_25580 [Proteobacteria bacterium]|nr:hypothetical protein [Pseudomonadota bacterium]